MLRIIPKEGVKGLPRFFTFDIYSWENCLSFIELITETQSAKGFSFKSNYNSYDFGLSEYEPASYSGVIVSNQETLRAESSREIHYKDGKRRRLSGLQAICEGKTPDVSCLISLEKPETSWFANCPESVAQHQILIIKKVLSHLDLAHDSFSPLFMQGYFEWVHTKTGKIKFWDYKTNPSFYQ